jgi:hypothetical protein
VQSAIGGRMFPRRKVNWRLSGTSFDPGASGVAKSGRRYIAGYPGVNVIGIVVVQS